VAARRRFTWDGHRYRDNLTGRFVGERDLERAILRALRAEQQRLVALGDALASDSITLREFREQSDGALREIHSYAAAAARGGWRHMNASTWGQVGARVRAQRAHRDKMIAQVRAGRQQFDRGFAHRLDMYAQAGKSTYYQHRNAVKKEQGRGEYRRKLSAIADHCESKGGRRGCVEVAADGWKPIGTLEQIGECACLTGCQCTWEYR
jgi:hypothetical protein